MRYRCMCPGDEMLICSVCGLSYPTGNTCPLDDAPLQPAPQEHPDAQTDPLPPVDNPEQTLDLTDTDTETTDTDTENELDAVPDVLLMEDVFSASDLIPTEGSSAPEEMVMVRGGKFLPPVPLDQAEPTLPTIQLLSTSAVKTEVEITAPAPFEEGYFSASDLVPVSDLPLSPSSQEENVFEVAYPPSSPENAVSDMFAKIVSPEEKRSASASPALPEERVGSAPADPWIGFLIGEYQIAQKLGVGGTGSVYRATYLPTGRQVAIKILHPRHSAQSDALWRLFDEARAANKIRHPHIIDIIDVGVISNNRSGFLIMELLEGYSLDHLLRGRRSLPPKELQKIFIPIAEALSAAHAVGIVHRDLKPDNVFLCRHQGQDDFVKILDFGIAKLSDRANNFRTQAGIVVGTPAYMSPEQASGQRVDARADIYSLGVMLYQCLTGELPFRASTAAELLLKQVFEPPPPLHTRTLVHSVSPQLRALVQRCLEKDPSLRPQSMEEVLFVLRDPRIVFPT